MQKKTTILLIWFLLCFFSAKAQNKDSVPSKAKVGLVLSGGGAKGLAHIGVLKVIDSLGVKVDYVAGTSMGAIIGSLYAVGYSGKQLDSIFKEVDFDNILSDNLPRSSKALYERENSEKYAVTLPFDRFKIALPSALSRGQNTYSLLSRLTLHVSDINDFSKLPIPFFCIGTNIETGATVMLDQGDLTQAVMASATLPSLFQPIIVGDQVLVDGGVTNNYPIDELRAKGMDVIVGVDVQSNLANRDQLVSAPSILMQISNFRTIKDMQLKVEKTDVYIKPEISDFSVVSFGDGKQIIESGVAAASSKIELLEQLPKYNTIKPSYRKHLQKRDSITINSFSLHGNNRYTRAYILGKLRLKLNEKIAVKDFYKGVDNLIATNNFHSVQYKFSTSDNNKALNLSTTVKETDNTTFLKLAVHYDRLYKSGALINVTKKRLFVDNDVSSLDLVLGDNIRYNFEYLIDNGFYWSVGIRSRLNKFSKNVNAKLFFDETEITTTGLNKIDIDYQDQTNQVYLQTLLKKYFALSMGLEHKRLKIKSETILTNNEEFKLDNTDYFSVFGNIKLDTYDNKYFPKRGVYFDGNLHMYLHASKFNIEFDKFSIVKANMGYAFSITDKFALQLTTSGGFKIGDKSTQSLDFVLGGYGNNLINNFIPFLGYDFLTLTGNSYVKAYLGGNYEVFKNHYISVEGNWANISNDIFENKEWFSLPDYNGYALGYSVDTLIGPIQAKYSYSPDTKDGVWFLNLGFWF